MNLKTLILDWPGTFAGPEEINSEELEKYILIQGLRSIMDLTIASAEDRQKWDDLVAHSSGGTVYHTLKWLRCVETHTTTKLLGHHYPGVLIPLVAREGAAIVALLPLFLYTGPAGIREIKSGSLDDNTSYLGPVFMDSGSLKPEKLQLRTMHLQKALDTYLKNELKSHFFTVRFSPFHTDVRPFIWDGYDVEPVFTYLFNLKNIIVACSEFNLLHPQITGQPLDFMRHDIGHPVGIPGN